MECSSTVEKSPADCSRAAVAKKVEHTPTIISFIRCNILFLLLILAKIMIPTIKSFWFPGWWYRAGCWAANSDRQVIFLIDIHNSPPCASLSWIKTPPNTFYASNLFFDKLVYVSLLRHSISSTLDQQGTMQHLGLVTKRFQVFWLFCPFWLERISGADRTESKIVQEIGAKKATILGSKIFW